MKLRNYKIKLLQAIEHPEESQQYFEKHIEVLKSFGVGDVSSVSSRWQFKPTVWLFILENESGTMIGGVRLDIKSGFKMPLEYALKSYPSIDRVTSTYEMNGGVAELCGLWIDKEYRKTNLALSLMKAALATAPNIGVKNILGFANEYSLKSTLKLGFKQLSSVENGGVFYYPDDRYKSFLIAINAIDLITKNPEDFDHIMLLRNSLKECIIEKSDESVNLIYYELETESIRIKVMADKIKRKLAKSA